MSRVGSTRGLAAAVGRLEKAARKGPRHCALCRRLRASRPGPRVPKEEVIYRKCEFCYCEQAIHLPPQSPSAEIMRMFLSLTIEDCYTDPKAHAFALWLGYAPGTAEPNATPRGNNQCAPLAGAKQPDELDRLLNQRHAKMLARYGEPFPEHSRLIASVEEGERAKRDTSVFVPGLKELWRKRTDYLICCELEKIIWGGTRPETEAAVERLSLEIDELVRSYAEAEGRRREESRVKNLEMINRLRAQQGLPPRLGGHR